MSSAWQRWPLLLLSMPNNFKHQIIYLVKWAIDFIQRMLLRFVFHVFSKSPWMPEHVAFIMDGNRRFSKSFIHGKENSIKRNAFENSISDTFAIVEPLQHFTSRQNSQSPNDVRTSKGSAVAQRKDKSKHIGHVLGFQRLEMVANMIDFCLFLLILFVD